MCAGDLVSAMLFRGGKNCIVKVQKDVQESQKSIIEWKKTLKTFCFVFQPYESSEMKKSMKALGIKDGMHD